MDDISMEIRHSTEHLTPLAGDANYPSTEWTVQVPVATVKWLSMLL